MKQLPEWANWLARNKGGKLWVFEHHPTKMSEIWFVREGALDIINEVDDRYAHIKWEYEEPTQVKRVDGGTVAIHNKTDPVNHPSHYKQGGLETIDIMQALLPHEQFIGYLKGNIIKYRERAEHKGNAEQDYAKAKWYYDKLMEVSN